MTRPNPNQSLAQAADIVRFVFDILEQLILQLTQQPNTELSLTNHLESTHCDPDVGIDFLRLWRKKLSIGQLSLEEVL